MLKTFCFAQKKTQTKMMVYEFCPLITSCPGRWFLHTIRHACQHACYRLHLKHLKSTKVEHVMFSLFKQIRSFTTSLNLSVSRKASKHACGTPRLFTSRNFNNPVVAHRWCWEREEKKKNEDVSFNLARRFFFVKPAGRKQLPSLQSMYVFVVALKGD